MRYRFAARRFRHWDEKLRDLQATLGSALVNCAPDSLNMDYVDSHYTMLITKALAKRNKWLTRAQRWGI